MVFHPTGLFCQVRVIMSKYVYAFERLLNCLFKVGSLINFDDIPRFLRGFLN